jgi:hypothetical protein
MRIKLAFFQGRQIAARDAFNGFETIEAVMAMELDELIRGSLELNIVMMLLARVVNELSIKGAYMLTWGNVFSDNKDTSCHKFKIFNGIVTRCIVRVSSRFKIVTRRSL